MTISCQNICKSFGERETLRDVSFIIEDKEKAAIVGANGAGKTTLLKIISGERTADSGSVITRGATIGVLSQLSDLTPENTVYEELLTAFSDILALESQMRICEKMMAKLSGAELQKEMKRHAELLQAFERGNGYEYESRVRGVIKGLGFTNEESEKPIAVFSGGQKTRVAMAKLLLSNPDALLLDEPTNHLDMDSLAWLEDYLKSYAGSVLLVSHDRFFIDKIVTKVIELENGKCSIYMGNYTDYAAKRKTAREIAFKHYEIQRREIRRQEETIRLLKSYNREKSVKRAESREKSLEKIERLEKPAELDKIRFAFNVSQESGLDVLSVRALSKTFGQTQLFRDVSFEIKKGDKAALIGPNGVGKTTLLKIIAGKIPADSGEIRKGANVKIGFAEQNTDVTQSSKTAIEEMSDLFPRMDLGRLRGSLASFLFTGDDAFKPVSALSGGELGRLALLKVMFSGANFITLDEPTNHLDADSSEALEDALRGYNGAALYVSHDRYFINKTATKVIELSLTGVSIFEGDYNYYLEKKKACPDVSPVLKTPEKPLERANLAETRKKRAELSKTEREIETVEKRLREIDEKMTEPEIATDHAALMNLFEEKRNLDENVVELYELWEKQADEV
ncbi:MAG: ABC-F family ATP-binding cassette domain-containing protein [Clostridiales bacterium]|jgi:ATP-binding cassette subfamily F protein 3|nr:ABC-F family ATP-binding cassette domain-containing protein [Clostridiales bacterium]